MTYHLADHGAQTAPQRPTAPPKLRALDTATLLTTTPPPLDWLAEGVWARGKLTLFGGREKRGKSLVQLALAVAAASGGGLIAGIPVKAARVLVIDAENGEREIHRRLRAMGLAVENADNLLIAEARGFELREDLDLVADLAAGHRADLVLLDSYRALWRGDERDEADVAASLDPVRELAHDREIAVSLIHHAQKAGAEYRGSTAIGASIEWSVMLDHDPEDPDRTRRRLSNPLARFAEQRDDRWLKIQNTGGDEGSVALVMANPFVREHAAPVRELIETELRSWIEDGGVSGVRVSNEVDTLTPPSWSLADLARAVGRQAKDQSVRRAAQRLADEGVLHRNGDGRWHRSATLLDDDREQAG